MQARPKIDKWNETHHKILYHSNYGKGRLSRYYYLRDVLDQSDSQFNVGEEVQVIQPGYLSSYGHEEGD